LEQNFVFFRYGPVGGQGQVQVNVEIGWLEHRLSKSLVRGATKRKVFKKKYQIAHDICFLATLFHA
jgi:hypothetical protein